MKRTVIALSLALVMALALCACGGGEDGGTTMGTKKGPLSGGTWSERKESVENLKSYGTEDVKGPIPADWTMPADFTVGDKTRIEISGDKILYGEFADGWLKGFTVASYADGALNTVYEFKDGVTTSWQQFFSPDGTKLAIAWKANTDANAWSLTLVDLTTKEASGLALPDMTVKTTVKDKETGKEKEETIPPSNIIVKWQDDKNLIVTGAPASIGADEELVSWLYTLPDGK